MSETANEYIPDCKDIAERPDVVYFRVPLTLIA